jgi:hypothetical protein
MEIMNICVLHLSDVERDTGSGVDREELIQWYLEQKETEFETEEDLEYERELIAKALTKLSRVGSISIHHKPIRKDQGSPRPTSIPLLGPLSFFLPRFFSVVLADLHPSLSTPSPEFLFVQSQVANVQDNYLLEIRGDVNSSLDPSNPQDETMDDETAADSNKVYYVVHPQVDLSDLSSSLTGV